MTDEKVAQTSPSVIQPSSDSCVDNAQTGTSMLPVERMSSSVKEFTIAKRNLPHWQNPGSVYFITFRTYNHIILDDISKQIIYDAILYQGKNNCKIHSFVIMPDHVHIILQPKEISKEEYLNLSKILQGIKGYSAKMIIKELKSQTGTSEISTQTGTSVLRSQTGTSVLPVHIFQAESFDRIIRNDEELFEKMNYILNNPVKRGLIENGYDYKWYYLSDYETTKNKAIYLDFAMSQAEYENFEAEG